MNTLKVTKKDLCFKLAQDLSITDNETRKFRGVAYSGEVIKDHPHWGDLIFDISSMSFKKRIPVLFNHDPMRIVGSGSLDKQDQLILNGDFSSTTLDGMNCFNLITKEEFPMEESVFIVPEVEELAAGKSTVVNGKKVNGPMTIFRNGKIREVSLTPLGADDNTSTHVFNLSTINVTIKEKKMSKANKNFLKFSELLEESPQEAFEFACGCNDKGTAAAADTSAMDALMAENEELKTKLDAALAELAMIKDGKAVEEKQMKARRVKEMFKKFDTEVSEDVIETYVSAPEAKFDTILSSVETNLRKIAGDKKFSSLTTATTVAASTENLEESDKLRKIQMKASDLRSKNENLTVPDSYAQARFHLGLKE